jgi:hypothetical protein
MNTQTMYQNWKNKTQTQTEAPTVLNVMDVNFKRADACGVHTRFTDPVSDSNKLQRQNAVADFIPGPVSGSHWSERAMRMIEDSLPEGCYLKTMKDGHINIMMNKRHLFLRLDTHSEGIKMSSYHRTPKGEDYLGPEGWKAYVDRVERLGNDWSVKTNGEGSRSQVKPRSIDLTGQTCKKITEEISKFLP